MRFAGTSLAALVAASLLLGAACSSGGSDEPGDDDEKTNSGETATPAGTRTSAAATATPAGKAPRFTPGPWTSGEAEARITGGATMTVKGTLNKNASSDKDTTRLIFVAGTDTISISISNVYEAFAMSVYKEPTDVQSNSASPCVVTYSETSETKVAGSFKCNNAKLNRGGSPVETMIEGTFVASR